MAAAAVIWLLSATAAWAQNCLITGGTNYGGITQNCTFVPPPLSILMDHFENRQDKDGLFDHRILVRFNAPVNMTLIACGDGVADVTAFPWPAGMMVGPSTTTHGNCTEKLFPNIAPGQWVFSVRTKAERDQFTLQPVMQ
jgi:hypothetical protein